MIFLILGLGILVLSKIISSTEDKGNYEEHYSAPSLEEQRLSDWDNLLQEEQEEYFNSPDNY